MLYSIIPSTYTYPCIGPDINATCLTVSFNRAKLNRFRRLSNVAHIFTTNSSFGYIQTKLQVLNIIVELSQTAVPSPLEPGSNMIVYSRKRLFSSISCVQTSLQRSLTSDRASSIAGPLKLCQSLQHPVLVKNYLIVFLFSQ